MRNVLRATAHLCAKRAHRIGERRRQVQNRNTNTHVRIVVRIFPRGISFSSILTRRNIRFPRRRGKRKINRILKSHCRHERGQRRRNGNQLHPRQSRRKHHRRNENGRRNSFVPRRICTNRGILARKTPLTRKIGRLGEQREKNSGIGLWRTYQS